ncbi:phosphatase PAP2 family protein [Legionella oakridgensis]|uniref:PAP2 superfamily n=2 Tax=Legionella oakridgensis TaxID=29423 RepID=W0BGW0_9GAMM|nr:phosphatase PAP2 family protein [Legionella oakridgensis]AHE67659.1 PAP2 superfamily [Legionella oakridgensis ATCC 33761 = DSM 21215]ETO92888.1 PAP2 superfamily [Legionella oakridgensis RV-2-2007]KTD37005.1 PAP2 superfamily protein [Legionella oakridgensis]STY20686.1 phosphoesterase, PA-phosphatase related [Legionella longbeachae]
MKPFDRLLSTLTKPWVAAAYWGFIILSFLYFDQPTAFFFYDLDLTAHWPFLKWITNIGLGGIYFISLFILALVFRYVYRQPHWEAQAWFLWLCVVIPSVICLLIKAALGRARPELLFYDGLYGFYGLKTHASFWSFPSGHSTTIMALVYGLSILFPRYGYAFIASGLTVAISRILLTNHYLSDVLAASYLALVEVGLLLCWLRHRNVLIHLPALIKNR